MMTSSSGNTFRVTGPLHGEFPSQRPVTQSFDVFFDLCLNKGLGKQPRHRWFETPSRPLWRQFNVVMQIWLLSEVILLFGGLCHTTRNDKVIEIRRQRVDFKQIVILLSLIPQCDFSNRQHGSWTSLVNSHTWLNRVGCYWSGCCYQVRLFRHPPR